MMWSAVRSLPALTWVLPEPSIAPTTWFVPDTTTPEAVLLFTTCAIAARRAQGRDRAGQFERGAGGDRDGHRARNGWRDAVGERQRAAADRDTATVERVGPESVVVPAPFCTMLTVPPLPIGPLTATVPVLAGVNVSVWGPDPTLIASSTVSEPPATCEMVSGVNISIPMLAPENADGLAELPPTVSVPVLPPMVVILLVNVKFPPVTRLALVASTPSPRPTVPLGLPGP